jgi:hypothetical protein
MSCSDRIKQGDTGPIWHVTVPKIDDEGVATGADAVLTNYTCSLVVDAQTQVITLQNTAATAFLVQLSSATTYLLSTGGYNVGIEIRDDTVTPPYVSEIHKQIQIATQLVD